MAVTPLAQASFEDGTTNLNIAAGTSTAVVTSGISNVAIGAANYSTRAARGSSLGLLRYDATDGNWPSDTDFFGADFSIWTAGVQASDGFPTNVTIEVGAQETYGFIVAMFMDYDGSDLQLGLNFSQTTQYVNFEYLDGTPIPNDTLLLVETIADQDNVQFGFSYENANGLFRFYSNKTGLLLTVRGIKTGNIAVPDTFGLLAVTTGVLSQDFRVYDKVMDFSSTITSVDDYHEELSTEVNLEDSTVDTLNFWSRSDPFLEQISTLTSPFDIGTVFSEASVSGQVLTTEQINCLNNWARNDPSLRDVGTTKNPFMLGDVLHEAMGSGPYTFLTAEEVEKLNEWSNTDPGLADANTLTKPFKMGDFILALQDR